MRVYGDVESVNLSNGRTLPTCDREWRESIGKSGYAIDRYSTNCAQRIRANDARRDNSRDRTRYAPTCPRCSALAPVADLLKVPREDRPRSSDLLCVPGPKYIDAVFIW